MTDRIGDWIMTWTGIHFYPLDPRPEDFDIRDIARALSHEPRYGGHTAFHYSVAQHSVLVSRLVSPRHRLHALMHDASEAYLKDIPRPLKRMLPEYAVIERRVQEACFDAFGMVNEIPDEVHEYDNRILLDEVDALFATHHALEFDSIRSKYQPTGISISPWVPAQAEANFLAAYQNLIGNLYA